MIIALSGPSGIGKGFIKEQLLQVYPFIEELIWLTTRPFRPNEQHSNRIHVSLPIFNQCVESGELVLTQKIYGHHYGLKEDLLPSSRVRLTELHPDNLEKAFKINPTILAIGFVTFDFALLHKRLSILRNTESVAEIEQRIAVAKIEIETILRQRSLFASVIEVSEASESSVFDQDSMLNCEWGNETPWREWQDHGVSQVKNTGCSIVISLSGRDLDSCCNLIRSFDKLGIDAYEINIFCSHSGVLHGNLNVDAFHLQQLMKKVHGVTTTPIWIKLSYSNLLVQMAREAENLGADAIVCTNSIGPGMLIDTKTAKPKLGIKGGGGGVTGRAIFPIALWCVHQLSQALTIPIVGCGGISTADHVIQMLMAGASAVQLYTAPALKGPVVFKRITNSLQNFFAKQTEYASVTDLIGLIANKAREHVFSSPLPVVIEEKCTGCGVCTYACAFDALELIHRPGKNALAVITDNCNSCNACVGVCPPKFNAIEESF